MRLHQAFIVVVVVSLFATTSSLSAATEIEQVKGSTLLPSQSIVGHDGAQGRSLRAVDSEDESSDLRGLWTNAKVRWWLEWEKSDDYVREALKLKGLKSDALTKHKNYGAFQYFLKKSEKYKLNTWYRHKYTTYQGWKELSLDKITSAKDLYKIRNTDKFNTYRNYVNYHNTMVHYTMKAGQSPPKAMVMRGASDAEMTARPEIMAEAGRSAKYAKLAFGLTDSAYPTANLLSGPELKGSPDQQFQPHCCDSRRYHRWSCRRRGIIIAGLIIRRKQRITRRFETLAVMGEPDMPYHRPISSFQLFLKKKETRN